MKKVSLIFLLLLLFISCGSNTVEKETVMFLHYFTDSSALGIDKISKVVSKKYKNINLITTPLEYEDFKIIIRLQLETLNPPDLFSYWAGARTKYLVEKGDVSPITNLFKTNIDRNNFDDAVINACSYNGEVYLLPLTKHFVGFFYNKIIFKNLNLTVPEKWDDLLIVAEKLKNNGITPFSLGSKNRWPSQFWFDYILLRTAGYNYREDLMNKTARYTDLEVLKTMDIWKILLDKDFINKNHKDMTWDNAARLLVEGKAAMTLMGTWAIPYLEKEGMIPEMDYGFFPFPTMDNSIKTVALGPIDGILLSSDSRKMDISKEILSLFAEKEIQEGFNITSGAIAPFNGVSDDTYSTIQLQIKSLIRKSPYWAFNYDLATEPATSEAGLNFFRDFLDSPDQYECLLIELQERIQND